MIVDNPIFKREFLTAARSLRTRFLILLYLVLLSCLLLMLWPATGIHSVVTENSRQIFSMFFCTNLALLMLLIPAFTAGAISLERETGTWPALFSTLLKPSDILFGKMAASSLMLLIVCILTLPIASVCALTGGINLAFLLKILSVLFLTALSYGLIGLACSAKCKHTSNSILLTYVWLLLLSGATWLPEALLSNPLPFLNRILWQPIRSISPFDAIGYLLFPDAYKVTVSVESVDSAMNPYTIFIAASIVISVTAFLVFYKNIRKPPTAAKYRKGEVYTEMKTAIKRKLTFPFYLLDPLKRKKPIGRFRNPVFVAEMRSRLFSNPQFVIRTVSAIFMLSMILLLLVSLQFGEQLKGDQVRLAAIVFQIGVVVLLAPGVSSSLITEEITGGTFTALRMTPISPLTIIFGKLKATFFYALIFIVSGIFVFIAMAFLQVQGASDNLSFFSGVFWQELGKNIVDAQWRADFFALYKSLFAWITILLMTTLTALIGGLFASSISRNTSVATAISYGFTGALCIVTLLPIPLADQLSHSAAEWILSLNPVVSAIQVTSSSFAEYGPLWITNIISLGILNIILLTGSVIRVWYLFNKSL